MDRGFTGHEHYDQFGVIDMNGRAYDPLLGRMLSPDAFVKDASIAGDYDRFAYVENNPLNCIDPTGYASQPAAASAFSKGPIVDPWEVRKASNSGVIVDGMPMDGSNASKLAQGGVIGVDNSTISFYYGYTFDVNGKNPQLAFNTSSTAKLGAVLLAMGGSVSLPTLTITADASKNAKESAAFRATVQDVLDNLNNFVTPGQNGFRSGNAQNGGGIGPATTAAMQLPSYSYAPVSYSPAMNLIRGVAFKALPVLYLIDLVNSTDVRVLHMEKPFGKVNRVGKDEMKNLQNNGFDPHDFKPQQGGPGGKIDFFKDAMGNLFWKTEKGTHFEPTFENFFIITGK